MKYCRQMRSANTGEWSYDLLAAVVHRAMLDAQGRGATAEDAQDWLDFIAGERWRQMTAQKAQGSTKSNAGYIATNVDSRPPGRLTTGRY